MQPDPRLIIPMTDHDLLIGLTVKVDSFIARQDDHEIRLRLIEKALDGQAGQEAGHKGIFNVLTVVLLVIAGLLEPGITLYVGLHR